MRSQVAQADRVLLVFTETYARRFWGAEAPGIGLGVTFEGVLATQALYESGARSARFRPVVFSEEDAQFIPPELRRFSRYRADTPENYKAVLRWLHEAPPVEPPPIGDKPGLRPEPAPGPLFGLAQPPRPKPVPPPLNAGEKGQLALLRRRVEWAWAKEVLEKLLFDRVLVELGIEARPDALDQPWERVVKLADHTRRALAPQTRVWDVYRECGNALLILGAPGSLGTGVATPDSAEKPRFAENCLR